MRKLFLVLVAVATLQTTQVFAEEAPGHTGAPGATGVPAGGAVGIAESTKSEPFSPAKLAELKSVCEGTRDVAVPSVKY